MSDNPFSFERADEEAWQREKAIMAEYQRRREEFAAQEREEAMRAVNKALSSYRWWGWTNIVNTVRIAIQQLRWRLRR